MPDTCLLIQGVGFHLAWGHMMGIYRYLERTLVEGGAKLRYAESKGRKNKKLNQKVSFLS